MKSAEPVTLDAKSLRKWERRRVRRLFVVIPLMIVVIYCWRQRHSLFEVVSSKAALSATQKTYYISPGGNDANSGLTASLAWLSPDHPLNCGDTIIAASGIYSNANFYTGRWGTVACSAGNNVAWLKCAVFDTCKITATNGSQAMWVDQSYWGVQGWEASTAASAIYGTCFIAAPNWTSPATIHHIVFANDIANGCSQGGFTTTSHGKYGVDYLVVIENIAYNAAQGSNTCSSGISIYQPVQSDSRPGTHIYIAGNFSYSNVEPGKCNGSSPTDGDGIIFDTFDGGGGGQHSPYAAQSAAQNNILVNNGGKGIDIAHNAAGPVHAAIYLAQNTSWGNLTDTNQKWIGCGELTLTDAENVKAYRNLISTKSAIGCGGNPIYALSVQQGSSTNAFYDNFAFGYNGNNTFLYKSNSFSFAASNILGINPLFAKSTAPGAPNCLNSSNVSHCMAPLIAAFVPTTAAARGFGYRATADTSSYEALFPKWLCNTHLLTDLVTAGCAAHE